MIVNKIIHWKSISLFSYYTFTCSQAQTSSSGNTVKIESNVWLFYTKLQCELGVCIRHILLHSCPDSEFHSFLWVRQSQYRIKMWLSLSPTGDFAPWRCSCPGYPAPKSGINCEFLRQFQKNKHQQFLVNSLGSKLEQDQPEPSTPAWWQ